MKVVVCGGRAYHDHEHVWATLDTLNLQYRFTALAHGNAGEIGRLTGKLYGADRLAGAWAEAHDIPVTGYPVMEHDWEAYGRGAGPRRNRIMLDEFKPDLVVAFPGGAGTADCVKAALERRIEVTKIAEREITDR